MAPPGEPVVAGNDARSVDRADVSHVHQGVGSCLTIQDSDGLVPFWPLRAVLVVIRGLASPEKRNSGPGSGFDRPESPPERRNQNSLLVYTESAPIEVGGPADSTCRPHCGNNRSAACISYRYSARVVWGCHDDFGSPRTQLPSPAVQSQLARLEGGSRNRSLGNSGAYYRGNKTCKNGR